MKPFLSESCNRTDRDVGKGERKQVRLKEEETERDHGVGVGVRGGRERGERRQRLGTGIFVKTMDFK